MVPGCFIEKERVLEFVSHVSLEEHLGERYRRFVDHHPDLWSIFFLTENFPIGYANKALRERLTAMNFTLAGSSWFSVLGPRQDGAAQESMVQRLRAGHSVQATWFPPLYRENNPALVSQLTPLPMVAGEPECVLARQRVANPVITEVEPPAKSLHADALFHSALLNRLCALKYRLYQVQSGTAELQAIHTAAREVLTELETVEMGLPAPGPLP